MGKRLDCLVRFFLWKNKHKCTEQFRELGKANVYSAQIEFNVSAHVREALLENSNTTHDSIFSSLLVNQCLCVPSSPTSPHRDTPLWNTFRRNIANITKVKLRSGEPIFIPCRFGVIYSFAQVQCVSKLHITGIVSGDIYCKTARVLQNKGIY